MFNSGMQDVMATRLRLFTVLIILLPALSRAESYFRITVQDPQHLAIEISIPVPRFATINKAGTTSYRATIPDWPLGESGLPYLPIRLQLMSNKATLQVVSSSGDTTFNIPSIWKDLDRALGADTPDDSGYVITTASPAAPAVLRYDGQYGRLHLWTLQCTPFRHANGVLTFPQKLVCNIFTSTEDGTPLNLFSEEQKHLEDLGLAASVPQTVVKPTIKPLYKNESSTGQRLKIYIDRDGLYHITGKDLASTGLTLPDIEIKQLRLTCNNIKVPIYVSGWQDGRFGADDYIEFWGEYLKQTIQGRTPEAYQDPFTRTNIYWLSWDGEPGIWMSEEQAGVGDTKSRQWQRPFSFYETVHVESDNYFDRLSDIQEPDSLRDLWFMDSGVGSGSKRQYELYLACPDYKSPLGVRVNAWLAGRSTLSTEHKLSVFLNDERVLAGTGLRQSLMHLQTEADPLPSVTTLAAGRNVLTVINEADAKDIDFVMLDWFEVSYPRLYRARNGEFKFTIPPDYELGPFLFQIDGFSDKYVDVYKIGSSKMVGGRIEKKISSDGLESFTLSIQDQVMSRSTEYVAVEPFAKRKPLRMELAGPAWQFDGAVAVDYLVVTARRFMASPSLKKLIAHRQGQGYHVSLVTIEDIYDAFAAGRYSSQALKSALQWFYQQSRSPQLRYVLLVGDGCYDRNDAAGDSLDLIPVHFRQTVRYGATASDHWYALLSGDDEIPDVHIGRLPVREEQELAIVVDKIINQEMDPYNSDWRHRLLFIGGNGQEFRERAAALAFKSPLAWDSRMLFTVRGQGSFDPFFGSTADLLDDIDEGCAVVNFHGHGGGAIWSDNGLLRLEDVERMANRNRYPLVLSMTCFTGAFEAASNSSLADAMLFAADRGTMAFFGASGLGWLTNDDLLQTEIMQYLYEHPQQTMGEIIDAGKIRYYTKYYSDIAVSQVIQYNFFGDPAARVLAPAQTLAMSVPTQVVNKGDTLAALVQLPVSRALLRWQLLDSSLVLLESKSQMVNSPQARANFVIPSAMRSGQGVIRLFAGDDLGTSCYHAAALFSTSGLVFDSVKIVHKRGDSIAFVVRIKSTVPFRQGHCQVYDKEFKLVASDQDWFTTPYYFLSFNMSVVQFRFSAELEDGRIFNTPWYERPVREVPDLSVLNETMHWAGTDVPELAISVYNRGSGKAEGYYLQLEEANLILNKWQRVSMVPFNCPSLGSADIVIPYAPTAGDHFIRFIVDADSNIENGFLTQSMAQFQTEAFAYRPQNGINGTDTLHYDSHCSIVLGAGSFPEPGVLFLHTNLQPLISEQPDFLPGPWHRSYQVSFSKNSPVLKPVRLVILSDGLSYPSLFRFSSATKKWIRVAGEIRGQTLAADVAEWGEYTVLYGVDDKPPVVEVHIDGKPYQPHLLTALQPQISLALQDQNGIDVSTLIVTVDGQPHDALTLPDSIRNANQVHLAGLVGLSAGEHRLHVSVQDCFGNAMDPLDMVIEVAADFQLTVLGNYPNPFTTSTTFAYTLTQPAEQIQLKIFGASGRLLRTLDPQQEGQDPNPLGTDYHELTWDGLDQQGYDAANGVYFYRFSALYKGEKKEVMGKIARIK
jgi:hypothetical protein